MTHDKHGWNDDEETIINFTPKARPARTPSGQEPMPAYPQDVLGPGDAAASTSTEDADTARYHADPEVPPLTSMATPPPSRPYGGDALINSLRPWAGVMNTAEAVVTTAGQDPYLAIAGVQEAFPSGGKSNPSSSLPPVPPMLDLDHVPRNTAIYGTPPPAGYQPPVLPEAPLPGFGPPPPMSEMPAPAAESVSSSPGVLPLVPASIIKEPWRQTPMPLFTEHRGPGVAPSLDSDVRPDNPAPQEMPSAQSIEAEQAATAEAPVTDEVPVNTDYLTEEAAKTDFRANIDPPTIMDVPLMARRVLDLMQQRESCPAPYELRSDVAEADLPPNTPPADDVLAELTPAAVSEEDAGSQRDAGAPAAVPPAQTRADEEWALPCEDSMVASAGSPVVNAPEPIEPRVVRPEDVQSAAWSLDSIDAARQPASVLDDSRIEPAMERTNLHLPIRATEAVADVAWVVILRSPSAHIHEMYRLDAIRMELGRSFDAPIFVDDKTISSRHAAIRYERVNDHFEFVLYDLASTNGTFVNGAPVHVAVLKDDDRIRVGETDLVFKKVGDPPAV